MKFKHIPFLSTGVLFGLFTLSTPTEANDTAKNQHGLSAQHTPSTAVQAVPFNPRLTLQPNETHSGLRLPRWVSIKHGTVNGRKGPGKHYPHLWTFQRKGMPVIVVNEMDHWRKIRDIQGEESWVRSVALSGESRAIVKHTTPLLKSDKASARVLAQLASNLLVKIRKCGPDYCSVEIDMEVSKGKKKGPKGYVQRADLWGVQKF